jgi:hypothetical protein
MQAPLICGMVAFAGNRCDRLAKRLNKTRNRYAVNEYTTFEMK